MQLKGLKTHFLARNFQFYEEIDSTQKQIWERKEKLENGSLIAANIQTSGKRYTWKSVGY